MKKNLIIIAAVAAMVFGSVSCQKEALSEKADVVTLGGTLDEIKVIRNTATRVGIDENLYPFFEIDDEIFGWDTEGNSYSYKCTAATERDATFTRTSESAPSAVEGTYVNLIYAPGYGTEDIVDKTLDVNLAVQTGLPAIMHAMGEVDAQGLCEVSFYNDVAIVDVKDAVLPGADENEEFTLAFHGKYNSLKFAFRDFVYLDSQPTTEGTITKSEKVKAGAESKISAKFAVPASLGATEVIITATAADGSIYTFSAGSKEIVAGKYINVSGKEFTPQYVATLTVGDGQPQPFTAIGDAFTAAIAQEENSECTIQLLEDCEIKAKIDITKKIKLMLDLNGKTLTLKSTNRINLNCDGAEYIIDDKSGSEGTYQQSSTSNAYVIAITAGKFTVNKGKLTHAGTSPAIYLSSSSASASETMGFEMNGGSVVTTDKACNAVVNVASNEAEVSIKGGSLTMSNNTGGHALYFQKGKSVTVEDGTLTSSGMAVRATAADGSVNISGGKFVGDTTSLYMSKGNLTITGGEFSTTTTRANASKLGAIDLKGTNSANMGQVRISGATVTNAKGYKAIYVEYVPDMEISSGEFSALRHVVYVGTNSNDKTKLTIKGGEFKNTSNYPVIYNGGTSNTIVTGGYFYRTNTTKKLIFQTSSSGKATIKLSGGYCNMSPQESIDPTDNFVSLVDGYVIKDDGEGDYKYYIVKE